MTAKADDPVLKMWKQQVGVALRLVETITDESKKLREFQLAAALEAHRSAQAARQLMESATDAQELWRIQNDWLSASLQKSLAYWRGLYEAAAQAQFGVTRCLCGPLGGIQPQAPMPSNIALFDVMNDAYKRWLDTSRSFYGAPVTLAARKAA